jgi:hypothetical protein
VKRPAYGFLGVALVALVLASEAWAPAPRGSIQQAGLVLKKLDLSQPPSYPQEFFSPPPAPGEMGGRERLSNDVSGALRIMGDPQATGGVWCPSINDILNLATGTVTYFDITYVSNPALDDFKKDWLKVQKQAEC